MQKILINLLLLSFSVLLALGGLEIVSRFVLPISPGAWNVDLDGTPLVSVTDGKFRYQANLEFRQVSNEFDALVSINRFGNRTTGSDQKPNIIFIGDSFTFGHGLSDKETFAYKYCFATKLKCANLGRSGSGTLVQLDVLEHYLNEENWRPIEVKLFVLAMTSTLMSGNDLLDNYYYVKVRSVKATSFPGSKAVNEVRAPENIDRWLSLRTAAIKHSNLMRVLYYYLAPVLKSSLSPTPEKSTLGTALEATKEAFERLERLGKQYGFKYGIYILHPLQDIVRKTDGATRGALANLLPGKTMFDTAELFKMNPTENYYSFDGHFNQTGAQKIATFLLSQSAK